MRWFRQFAGAALTIMMVYNTLKRQLRSWGISRAVLTSQPEQDWQWAQWQSLLLAQLQTERKPPRYVCQPEWPGSPLYQCRAQGSRPNQSYCSSVVVRATQFRARLASSLSSQVPAPMSG
jgi:hypothetical protein